MTSENRWGFDRGSWLTLGLVLLLAVISAVTAILLQLRVGDGCVLDTFSVEAVTVEACVGDWPTPLRPGDELVAIPGVDAFGGTDLHRPALPPGWVEGGTVSYAVRRDGRALDLTVPLHRLNAGGIVRAYSYAARQQLVEWNTLIFLGALAIFALAPRDRAAQRLLVAMGGLTVVTTLSWPGNSVAATFAPTPLAAAAFLLDGVWGCFFVPTLLLLVLSFPRRVWPLTRRPRLAGGLLYGLPLAAYALTFITTKAVFALAALGLGVLLVATALLVVPAHTFLRVRDPVIRAQTTWLALGLAVGLLFWPSFFILSLLVPDLLPALGQLPGWIEFAVIATQQLVFSACLGIAITRYRLFDIDIVINRALVYGSLTALVIGAYVAIVGTFGALLRGGGRLAPSLIATGIVAVLFQPLRGRVQRGVNRLLYGERDEPYAVLARLGRRLEGTLAPDVALPAIVGTVREALNLPYAAIALRRDAAVTIAASSGTPTEATLRLPLLADQEEVGELILAPRAAGEQFGPADRRLLADLARQISVAARAVRLHEETARLAADLQASRERLVLAREEERRRLRRDLHDGLGPVLGSLTLKLDVANDLLDRDPVAARALLDELRLQGEGAVADIRRLVYALRPAALDELGLVDALLQVAEGYGPSAPSVIIEAPEPLPPLPAAVEVAAFRIAQEALTNVVKHAGARRCLIRLALRDGALGLEVRDDGRGLAPERGRGLGLASMRERAAELGGACRVEAGAAGGTCVQATFPLSGSVAPRADPVTLTPTRASVRED